MKDIEFWLSEYSKSHQNKINKIIHWICVPLIFWSIVLILSLIPASFLKVFNNYLLNEISNWGTIAIIMGLFFYLRLSFNLFLGMLCFSIIVILDIHLKLYLFEHNKFWGLFDFLTISGEKFLFIQGIIVFIISWILQFIGHKIEGKKPSFFMDIKFLLIGPAWIISFIYNKYNIKV